MESVVAPKFKIEIKFKIEFKIDFPLYGALIQQYESKVKFKIFKLFKFYYF